MSPGFFGLKMVTNPETGHTIVFLTLFTSENDKLEFISLLMRASVNQFLSPCVVAAACHFLQCILIVVLNEFRPCSSPIYAHQG